MGWFLFNGWSLFSRNNTTLLNKNHSHRPQTVSIAFLTLLLSRKMKLPPNWQRHSWCTSHRPGCSTISPFHPAFRLHSQALPFWMDTISRNGLGKCGPSECTVGSANQNIEIFKRNESAAISHRVVHPDLLLVPHIDRPVPARRGQLLESRIPVHSRDIPPVAVR